MKLSGLVVFFILFIDLCNGKDILAPKIRVSPDSWDFGRISQGESVTKIFKIENKGRKELVINRVRTSCGCTAALVSNQTIAPGESTELKVTFDSSGRLGGFTKHVYIESNDPDEPNKGVFISGEVVERLVRMYLFYSQDCQACLAIKEDYLPRLSQKYPLEVRYFLIEEPENYQLMLTLEARYNRKLKNPPPTIFINGQVLDGAKEIKKKLEKIVKDSYLRGGCPWPDEGGVNETKAIERFKNLGVLAIIGGGLLDGINPCAFSVLMLFISYLVIVGRKGRELLLAGSFFTLAIFMVYLLVGVGLFEFIKKVAIFSLFSRMIIILLASLMLFFGILNLFHYYQIKKGRLGFSCPASLERVSLVIKRYSNTRFYILGAFISGFLVSFLEFFCTGQIYLPIVFVLRYIPELRIHALFYLVLYNLMFILPLIIVFIFTYYGITSEWIDKLIHRHLAKVKILTATLFFGIAGILFFI